MTEKYPIRDLITSRTYIYTRYASGNCTKRETGPNTETESVNVKQLRDAVEEGEVIAKF